LFEDARVNRLVEGLNLFNDTSNSVCLFLAFVFLVGASCLTLRFTTMTQKWFSSTSILLFLNKVDLFKEKFVDRRVPLNISGLFPTAPDLDTPIDQALKWMSDLFLEKRIDKEQSTFVHYTTVIFCIYKKMVVD